MVVTVASLPKCHCMHFSICNCCNCEIGLKSAVCIASCLAMEQLACAIVQTKIAKAKKMQRWDFCKTLHYAKKNCKILQKSANFPGVEFWNYTKKSCNLQSPPPLTITLNPFLITLCDLWTGAQRFGKHAYKFPQGGEEENLHCEWVLSVGRRHFQISAGGVKNAKCNFLET